MKTCPHVDGHPWRVFILVTTNTPGEHLLRAHHYWTEGEHVQFYLNGEPRQRLGINLIKSIRPSVRG